MLHTLNGAIGRLRLYTLLEGVSLILLVFIAMPFKYVGDDPTLVKILGPIHGGLFLLFLYQVFTVSPEQKWKFWDTTWKLIFWSCIPFGTFYIDRKILKPLAV